MQDQRQAWHLNSVQVWEQSLSFTEAPGAGWAVGAAAEAGQVSKGLGLPTGL